jgi:V-type H+-transporting ATPase subunit e
MHCTFFFVTFILQLIVTIIVIGGTWMGASMNRISKDSAKQITVVATIFGISFWLLWLCAWMHQWHPLITPTWKAA